MIAEAQPLGRARQRRRSRRATAFIFDFSPSSNSGKLAEQQVGDDEAEHGVAEELERLVVDDAAARRPRWRARCASSRARAARGRGTGSRSPSAAPRTRRAAARAGRSGSSVRWPSMMRRASSASSSRTEMRTSPRPLTVSGKIVCGTSDDDDRRHAVRLEQPAHDARLDVGVRPEDDDEVRHAARSISQQNHRHVVVLRRVADERRDLAQHALAQLVGRQVARAPRRAARAASRRSSRPPRSSPR